MEFTQLKTFVMVLKHRSFSRAATALGIGQSTVSFHIQALERSLGTRLLDRQGGQVRATVAGRSLERDAVRLLALRDGAEARLRSEASGDTGTLEIAASTIPGDYLLPPVLARFHRAHPRVQINVEVSDSRRALARLLADECQIALVGARPREPRIRFTAFAEDRVVLIAPPRKLAAFRHPKRWRDLVGLPVIEREEGSGTRDAVLAAVGRSLPPTEAILRVGSSEGVKQGVRNGLGLAFVSSVSVADDLAAGRVELVKLPGLPIRRRFWSATRPRVTLPPPAAALQALLIQKYRSR